MTSLFLLQRFELDRHSGCLINRLLFGCFSLWQWSLFDLRFWRLLATRNVTFGRTRAQRSKVWITFFFGGLFVKCWAISVGFLYRGGQLLIQVQLRRVLGHVRQLRSWLAKLRPCFSLLQLLLLMFWRIILTG